MNPIKKLLGNANDFLIDYPKIKRSVTWFGILLVEIIGAFIFAFGFKAFINPPSGVVSLWQEQEQAKIIAAQAQGVTIYPTITNYDVTSPSHLISGGASGVSQLIVKFISIFVSLNAVAPNMDLENTIISVCYLLINIPLFILAWRKISKQFAVFTLINVLLTSFFMQIIPDSFIANAVNLYSDTLARSIFGGITTGVSSGLAMIVGSSGGGSDIIIMHMAEKKSTSAGKYSLVINTTIVITYVTLSVIGHATHPEWNTQDNNRVISLALYTIIYSFIAASTVDIINQRNKKQELQVFTSNEGMGRVMVHSFPHSATIVESKGAFSGRKNYMIYMVISKSEVKKATLIIKQSDPYAFFTVSDLNQVFGRFYVKPLDLQ
ncbi:MAG: YitT family protein [Bacilli bacterium]